MIASFAKCSFVLIIIFLNFSTYAQEEKPIGLTRNHCSYSLGLGPGYAFGPEAWGLGGRFYFNRGRHFCFGPEVAYYFTDQSFAEEGEYLFETNLNAHYIFWLNHSLAFYPVGGLNYTLEKEASAHEAALHTVEALGLNLGGGVHAEYRHWILFAEYKYLLSQLQETFFTAGILFTFHQLQE